MRQIESKINRIIHLLTVLPLGNGLTIENLTKLLGVSRRTIFRDLKELKKAGVACHFDKLSHCYTIHKTIPPSYLTQQEALGLLLFVHNARDCCNFPFKLSILKAIAKIENTLPEKMKNYCNSLLRNISIKANPKMAIESLDRKFLCLQKAVVQKQSVEIRYYIPSSTVISLH